MNALERAVIDAARNDRDLSPALTNAVAALDAHERELAAAGTREIEWSLVVTGDEIRGKSGSFFPVMATRREVEMGRFTGRYVIRVGLPSGPRDLVRPHPDEPFATVRRSPDGQAVDEFVNVFSSGDL